MTRGWEQFRARVWSPGPAALHKDDVKCPAVPAGSAEGKESLDELLPEAFALVRQAAQRTLGMRHHDVQLVQSLAQLCVASPLGQRRLMACSLPPTSACLKLAAGWVPCCCHRVSQVGLEQASKACVMLLRPQLCTPALAARACLELQGQAQKHSFCQLIRPDCVMQVGGMILHEGNVAEMHTGEGKTLMATLPAYLNALTGRGVHIVTANSYLAQRDAAWYVGACTFVALLVSTCGTKAGSCMCIGSSACTTPHTELGCSVL